MSDTKKIAGASTKTKDRFNIVCLPGDGIGPEVMNSAMKVLDWTTRRFALHIETQTALFGGSSIDQFGEPLTQETKSLCQQADAVLLGAVGGAKWDAEPQHNRPEAGLLNIRQELGLFCNMRPAQVYNSLLESSPLKSEVVLGTDIMVVRELTGGIYFGSPRGANENEAWNTERYQRSEVVRIAQSAFKLARARKKKVTSVDKANVLEVSQFWRSVVEEVHRDFPDVALNHMYVDNAAMQLVKNPKAFDVVLTSNIFGDILSDLAGMLTGSLGMLASASLGHAHALYEPVHGSAPDIAGQNKANPFGMIGSLAMCFEYSLGRADIAGLYHQAIHRTFEKNYRTLDIASSGKTILGTKEITDRYIETLEELFANESSKGGQV